MLKRFFVNILLLLFIVATLTFGCSCKKQTAKENTINNPFDYDTMESFEQKNAGIPIDEYREVMNKTYQLSKQDNMQDVIITANDKEITRYEYESLKLIKEVQYKITEKQIIYSIIKPRILNSEAEKLVLSPNQTDIDGYMADARKVMEDEDLYVGGGEYVNVYMDCMHLTREEYLDDQRKNAYNMFQREALYKYAQTLNEYESYEEYEKHLINSAKIVFHDPEIEKLCK